MQNFSQFLSGDGAKAGLTLLLSFLMGLEREEHRESGGFFGGVRLYPLIGLMGFLLMRMGDGDIQPVLVGFATVAAFLMASYIKKVWSKGDPIFTSEASALLTYLIGVLVYRGDFWLATALAVVVSMIFELQKDLEGLTKRVPEKEIFTLSQFLLLAGVILPVVPNESFTSFNLNPYKIWLIVVVISSISYAAYVLAKWIGDRGSVLASAFLGGAYSSTMTTLVLAKQSVHDSSPRLFSGAILVASGMMYVRLVGLLAVINPQIAVQLAPQFLILGSLALLGGTLWAHFRPEKSLPSIEPANKNPLEIRAALLFSLLFVVMAILTKLAQTAWGASGIYALAIISGLSDIDPFIMSLSQSAGRSTELLTATNAIALAAISNNVLKAGYTVIFAKGQTRLQAAVLLLSLSLLGLILFFIF